MSKLIFNESNPNYKSNDAFNTIFILTQERYVNDLLKSKGYIYLNQIYELLGFEWNPKHNNTCFVNKKGKFICFNTTYTKSGVEIEIELI